MKVPVSEPKFLQCVFYVWLRNLCWFSWAGVNVQGLCIDTRVFPSLVEFIEFIDIILNVCGIK